MVFLASSTPNDMLIRPVAKVSGLGTAHRTYIQRDTHTHREREREREKNRQTDRQRERDTRYSLLACQRPLQAVRVHALSLLIYIYL